jgi:hypothetical protein
MVIGGRSCCLTAHTRFNVVLPMVGASSKNGAQICALSEKRTVKAPVLFCFLETRRPRDVG